MAAKENERVNTAFIGFFLMGLFLLMMGVIGLQCGGVFGEYNAANYSNMPIDAHVFMNVVMVIGLLFILITIFSYRIGLKNATFFFAFFGIALMATSYNELYSTNSNWFLYLAIAIFALILAIYLLMNSTPKFITAFTVLMAVMFFFFTLASFYSWSGPSPNTDVYKAMSIVYGIIALLGFVISAYLGLAVADRKKVPLI